MNEKKTEIFTSEELKALNFEYHELTVEDEFQYDFWTITIMGVSLEITNEYDLKGNLIKQAWELNEMDISVTHTKENVLQLIQILQQCNTLNQKSK